MSVFVICTLSGNRGLIDFDQATIKLSTYQVIVYYRIDDFKTCQDGNEEQSLLIVLDVR